MAKILVFTSGCDWADASCNHYVELKPFDINHERELRDQRPTWISMSDWLEQRGLIGEVPDLIYIDDIRGLTGDDY